jgi:hypothetical protein
MLPARQRQAQRLRVLKHRQPERLVQPVLLQRERVQRPVQERELLLSFRKQRGQRQQ